MLLSCFRKSRPLVGLKFNRRYRFFAESLAHHRRRATGRDDRVKMCIRVRLAGDFSHSPFKLIEMPRQKRNRANVLPPNRLVVFLAEMRFRTPGIENVRANDLMFDFRLLQSIQDCIAVSVHIVDGCTRRRINLPAVCVFRPIIINFVVLTSSDSFSPISFGSLEYILCAHP